MTSQPTHRVVVGVDGSPDALRAVRWAAAEAARRHAALHLVSSYVWAQDRMPGLPGLSPNAAGDHLRAAAENAATEAAAVATETLPASAVDREVVVGFAAAVLVDRSRDAELVVVGSRGLGRISSVFAGSTAVATATHAACPTVIVRGAEHAGGPVGPVVVGIDGTLTSEAAIAFAFDAAAARRAPLVAVHTWVQVLGDPNLAAITDFRALADEEREVLAERLAGWGEKYPDVEVRRVVAQGGAARALLDLAADAQLVVVGSRGHGELAGVLLGSVSNALVHAAPCPVVVVRPAAS